MTLQDKDTVRYIGGELISSDKIPLGTIGKVSKEDDKLIITWDNGVIGKACAKKEYKQIEIV